MKERGGKWIKLGIGFLLLPICYGCTRAVIEVIGRSGRADAFWAAFLAGAGSWVVCFILLPRPMWVYVFGHELSHALWAWAFGGKVSRFRVSAKGGSVTTDRTNFLVALAPYYFPLYALVVALLYNVWGWWYDTSAMRPGFHWLLGVTYAFHVTLNLYALRARQSDLVDQGYVFSLVVIWLANMVVLTLSLPLLTGLPEPWVGLRLAWDHTLASVRYVVALGGMPKFR